MAQHKIGDFRLMPIAGKIGEDIRIGQALIGDKLVPVQHAQIYLGGYLFLDAEPGGARLDKYPQLDGPNLFWSSGIINVTTEQQLKIQTAAYKYVGVPYSFLDYYAIAAHRFHIPAPGLQNYIASSKHMICSQLVDKCYQDAGIQLFNDKRFNGYVTPADLYWLLKGIQLKD